MPQNSNKENEPKSNPTLHRYQQLNGIVLGTVQYLLKGRAGGKAKFHEKKLPALLSIK
jgi:hypothetical protein